MGRSVKRKLGACYCSHAISLGWGKRAEKGLLPDGEVFINDTHPPLGALPGDRHGRQTHVHGGSCR